MIFSRLSQAAFFVKTHCSYFGIGVRITLVLPLAMELTPWQKKEKTGRLLDAIPVFGQSLLYFRTLYGYRNNRLRKKPCDAASHLLNLLRN